MSADTSSPTEVASGTPPELKRNLSIWEAIGVSVALMAPSMAININPQSTAGSVGRAVPLAFLLATISVLLIAYTFVRLSQRFSHSGSVYAFVGATLGAKSGAFSGWALVGTYSFYGMVTSMAAGRLCVGLLQALGIWANAPEWFGFVIGLIVVGITLYFATRPARGSTRLLFIIEATTVTLIVIVAAVIVGKLLTGSAPGGQHFDLSVFTIAPGNNLSTVFLGVVFAFLSFAGFEASATLGEETNEPRKNIPRAILGTAIFGGVYFVVITAVEVMGFGTGKHGVTALINSPSLIGDLGASYVAPWLGDVITLGAMISAIACCLACIVGASRLIFALSRDGLGPVAFSKVSKVNGSPDRASAAVAGVVALGILLAWAVFHGQPTDLFNVAGTAGTLIILVVYGLSTLGAIKLLFFGPTKTVRAWEIVLPILALVVLVYTLFRNIYPFPSGSAWWGPGLAIVWLVCALIAILSRPAAARAAGQKLLQAEGLKLDSSE